MKNNNKWRRSRLGLIRSIFKRQRERVNISMTYSSDELMSWVLSQDIFENLYIKWVKSNYNINLIPSIDRKNDYKGYSLDNIQLMTWKENREKGDRDRKNGINNKQNSAILQLNIDGSFIAEYHSMMEAQRITGIKNNQICYCCKGVVGYKTAGGFLWKYKEVRI